MRAKKFLYFLSQRSEKEIIVVSHGNYLERLLTDVLKNDEYHTNKLRNCEIRTYLIDFPDSRFTVDDI
jgi:hypothetical protein